MQNGRTSLIFMIVSIVCLCASVIFVLFTLGLRKSNITISAQEDAKETSLSFNNDNSEDIHSDSPSFDNNTEEGNSEIPKHHLLPIVTFLQMPELPNGCEIVSLATVLRYLGFDIDKKEFARDYLPCGPVGTTAPDVAYVGDPTSSKSGTAYGCLAPVITRVANKFLRDNEADYYAVNLTGTPLCELKEYVANGIPVIMWTTLEMRKSQITATWTIDGTKYTWLTYSHCTVLTGYTANDYIFADPLYDLVSYSADKVESAYKAQYMQAVAILPKIVK